MATYPRRVLGLAPGVVLGIGLGGFVDGIVLHQILQWHHMLTSDGYPPTSVHNLQVNTLADGLFHAFAFVMTALGLALLWRSTRRSHGPLPTKMLIGLLLIGWGLFNDIEGLVDHQILGIHHVRPGPHQFAYDMGFLAWGAIMLVGGWALLQAGRREIVPDLKARVRGRTS